MVIRRLIKRVFARQKRRAQSRCGCCAGLLGKLLSSCRLRSKWLKLSSPCQGAVCQEVAQGADGSFRSFCPICKRPVEARLATSPSRCQPVPGRRAYVATLWGANPGDMLGAAVLAKSMQRVGVRYELVLMHTDSVPAAALELLARAGWTRQVCVEPVFGVDRLYNHYDPRFKLVFTKIQTMGLLDYEKILLVDIDTLMLQNMDAVFDLEAPAALMRGPQLGYVNGEPLDGSTFFGDAYSGRKTWGQCGGINGGVMLLAPNEQEHQQMLLEVLDPNHPSHIRGNGPEQDYLSRFWADRWTQLGVEYNYQLHQLYYALNPIRCTEGERRRLLSHGSPDDNIYLMHYSGSLKPWVRVLDEQYAKGPEGDKHFLDDTLRSFNGYWIWVLRDRETLEQKGPQEGVNLDAEGKLRHIVWRYGQWTLGDEVVQPESLYSDAENVVSHALTRWNETLRALEVDFGGIDLVGAVQQICAPDVPVPAPTPSPGPVAGWKSCGGWWVDAPAQERVSVLAGCVPEPYVVFSSQRKVLLELRGEAAAGVHAVALRADGSVAPGPGGDVPGWAAAVPVGSLVLLAVVGLAPEAAGEVLQAFAANDFGHVPSEPPPADCAVAVLAGRRGHRESFETMASADFALVGTPWADVEGRW